MLRAPILSTSRKESAIRDEPINPINVYASSRVVPSDATLTRHYKKGGAMAYVRTKRVGDQKYYQLVESRRVNGKPRQKVLLHLGKHPTVDDALSEWPKEIRTLRNRAVKEREAGKTWPETSRIHREILKQTANEEKRADVLETNLKTLQDLRKRGVL